MSNVLAIDLGASSGRALLGKYHDGELSVTEIHRFDDYVIDHGDGHLSWDIELIMDHIYESMAQAEASHGFDSLSVDSWGVDFGLLDQEGHLIANPVHYRDKRTNGIPERAAEILSHEEIYEETGIQILAINTLYQLLAVKWHEPDVYERAETYLHIPDLIHYLLTGEKYAERSMASTSQLFSPHSLEWSDNIREAFDLKPSLFAPLIDAGEKVGVLNTDRATELGVAGKPVITCASHDTASAIASIPSDTPATFLSSGTWSLIGKELSKPFLTDERLFSNEYGAGNITLLSNLTGLWIIQQLREAYSQQGQDYTYREIAQLASEAEDLHAYIDVSDERFAEPGEMIQKVQDYLAETKHPVATEPGDIFRVVYESLALTYRQVLEEMESRLDNDQTGEVLYIVGGGTKATILNQLTANATQKTVHIGLSEGTGVGNILLQLVALGEVASLKDGRQLVEPLLQEELTGSAVYEPQDNAQWEVKYQEFIAKGSR